jgi:hypothetical protein
LAPQNTRATSREDHANRADAVEQIHAQQEPRDAAIDRQPQHERFRRQRTGKDQHEQNADTKARRRAKASTQPNFARDETRDLVLDARRGRAIDQVGGFLSHLVPLGLRVADALAA